MRLAVFGGHTGSGTRFIQRAKRDGFSVRHGDTLTIEASLDGAHAAVCLPDFSLDSHSIEELLDAADHHNVRRLIIVNATLMTHYDLYLEMRELCADSTIDWTIVQTISEVQEAIDRRPLSDFLVDAKDLATFLVNQITDPRYLQATVLVKA